MKKKKSHDNTIKKVELTLKKAGWFPRRCVDFTEWKNSLAAEGFELHSAAQEFLTEFGGLIVNVSGPW